MATYKVVYKSVCAGGEHVVLTVKKNGVTVRDFDVSKKELTTRTMDWEDILVVLLRECILHSGATTWAQAKAAIEAAEWVF